MSDAGAEYVVSHVKVRVRAAPSTEADIVDILCLGDVVLAVEVLEVRGETWARLAKGMELRCEKRAGSAPKVHMKLAEDGFVPVSHPRLGQPLKQQAPGAAPEEPCQPVSVGTGQTPQRGLLPSPPTPSLRRGGAGLAAAEAKAAAGTWLDAAEVSRAAARAAEWLACADAIVVGSGAGMGVDSGLSAARNAGSWPGLQDLNLGYEDMCQSKWFAEDPRLAWGFWSHAARSYQAAKPHAGYRLALEWAQSAALGYFSLTSNIDGHWQASDWDQDRIVEFHGAVGWLQCSKPCCPKVWEAEAVPDWGEAGLPERAAEEGEDKASLHRVRGELPTCQSCGAAARPAVQMFGGDTAFSKERKAAQLARYDSWLKGLAARPDYDKLSVVCLELGCGPAAPAVRKELEAVMRRFPAARFVRMNTEHPGFVNKDLRERGVSLPLKACDGLQMLQERLEAEVEMATFVLWDEDGDGVEVVAPANATVEQVLRLARRVPGVELVISTGASARVVHALAPGEDVEVPLNSPVPPQMLWDVHGPTKAAAAVLPGVQIRSGTSREVERRISSAIELLDDLNRIFGSEEYQAEVRAERDPQGVEDLIMAVHAQVLPLHGLGACEVQVMQARVGLVLCGSKEVEEKANLLVSLAYAGLGPSPEPSPDSSPSASSAPAPAAAEEAVEAASPSSPAAAAAPLPAAALAAAARACAGEEAGGEMTEVILVRLATEGSGKRQRLPMALPVGTTIGELRAKLSKAQGFSEDVARKVRFQVSKGEGRFRRLGEEEPAAPEIFMASVPPLLMPSEEAAETPTAVTAEAAPPAAACPAPVVPSSPPAPARAPGRAAAAAEGAPAVGKRTAGVVSAKSLPADDLWQCLALAGVGRWDSACVPLCLSLCLSAPLGGLSVAASVALCVCSLASLLASTVFGLSVALCLSTSTSVSLIRVALTLTGLPAENSFSSQNCLRGCMQICPSSRPFICLLMQL